MSRASHRRTRASSRVVVAVVTGLLAFAALALTVGAPPSGPAELTRPSADRAGQAGVPVSPLPGSATRPPAVDGSGDDLWRHVLHELDRHRASAFAAGDAAALATVYRRGSAVLARDRAVLVAYARRGLSVHGAGLRLLDVRALRVGEGRVVLRVVDRLRSATVHTGADAALPLPRDRPTVHRVVLHRGQGGWRIAAVAALSG